MKNVKKKTITEKKSKIIKFGEILIFLNVLKKNLIIDKFIKFNNLTYKLSGIIKHFGTKNYGHYIYIDYINQIIIDDTTITKCENLNYENIYMFFYTL